MTLFLFGVLVACFLFAGFWGGNGLWRGENVSVLQKSWRNSG